MRVPKARETILLKHGENEEVLTLLGKKTNGDIIRKFCPSKFGMDSVLLDLCDTHTYEDCKLCWATVIAIENNKSN